MKRAVIFFLMIFSITFIFQNKVSFGKNYAQGEFQRAAYDGNVSKLKEILESKPNPDERDSFGGTALHAAMFQSNTNIIEILIEYGLDVDAQGTGNGYTPMHDAVWAGNLEAAKILYQNGADITIKAKNGLTAEEFAKNSGKKEFIEFFKSIEN